MYRTCLIRQQEMSRQIPCQVRPRKVVLGLAIKSVRLIKAFEGAAQRDMRK